jgi:beta-lactamase regulating signal transducer with metallopeptidase domain
MSELGLMLAWSGVRITLVLVAAAALHALVSRRSPASGAWVASLGLGLAVAVGLLSPGLRGRLPGPAEPPAAQPISIASAGRAAPGGGGLGPADAAADDRPRLTLARLRAMWERLDRTAAGPAALCRPWGKLLALTCLTGAGCGLLRLVAGLWAVHLVRCRGRRVDDPELTRLLADLRASMACPRRVEVRETVELTTPATAGWWSAVILLPGDWRSWDVDERRAVLAHELAHVRREDYLTGVVARAAQALYFYHPLVHWLAARLRLEQELAADAFGARFAGGKARYLQSLSRLALRQDGCLPYWPARAFLPAKGTLIRRIAMLRDETKAPDRPWSGPGRALAALLLLTVAAAASLLRGPARADEKDGPAAAGSEHVLGELTGPFTVRHRVEPFDLSYVNDDSQGIVAIRPAAALRRSGMGVYRTMLNAMIAEQWAKAATALKFDPTKPGQGPLKVEMFDQIIGNVRLYRTNGPKPNGRFALTLSTVRTTEPVDWAALFRLFKGVVTEVHDGGRVYYRVKNMPVLGPELFFFRPDDRTVVFTGEEFPADAQKRMLRHLRRTAPPPAPAFAQGKDWDRSLRGLLLVALDNRGGRLANVLKGDDAEHLDFDPMPMFERSDLWTFGLDDDDQIEFRAVGTCPDGGASEAVARVIGALVDWARKQADAPEVQKTPRPAGEEKANRMARAFLENLRVEREGRSVLVRSAGLGTLAELASLVAASGIF